jgi:3-hydroxyisobutyrate dehydrogenase
MKIWFIGLGLMGLPMAKNILKKGFELGVYNRNKEKITELVSLGAIAYSSPEELAKNSDILITMVTAWDDVESVLFWEKGAVLWLQEESIVIDMSTIGVDWAKKISSKLQEKQIHFIDAPVTWSTPKAITGELTIFIGAEKEIYERVKPVLESMGANLRYMWPNGMWQAMKLINNTLVAYSMIWLSEVTKLAQAMWLDMQNYAETVKSIPVASPYIAMKIDTLVRDEFPLMFSLANMYKDIHLALGEMQKSGLQLDFLKLSDEKFRQWVEQGIGEMDLSAIAKIVGK